MEKCTKLHREGSHFLESVGRATFLPARAGQKCSEFSTSRLRMQLYGPRKSLERKCGKEWVLSKNQAEQTWTYHRVTLLDEMNSVACDALWKTRQEVCSVKQRQNFKSINGKVTIICKSISKAFDATCHNFNKTMQVQRQEMSQPLAEMDTLSESVHHNQIWCVGKCIGNSAVAMSGCRTTESRRLCRQMLVAFWPRICSSLKNVDRSEDEVAQLQDRCNEFWHYPEPTQ